MKERTYLAVDLKSFFASVECVERGLDPLTTNLVVADAARTEKTICLAVSPSLKAYGIPGRPRLFEVVQQVASDGSRPPAGSSPASRCWRKNYGRIPPSPSITSLPRPKWPSILRTAPASIRFTFAMSPRRISMSIPSMRFSSMPPTT